MHRKNRNYIENRKETMGIWGRITETKGEVKKAFFFSLHYKGSVGLGKKAKKRAQIKELELGADYRSYLYTYN